MVGDADLNHGDCCGASGSLGHQWEQRGVGHRFGNSLIDSTLVAGKNSHLSLAPPATSLLLTSSTT